MIYTSYYAKAYRSDWKDLTAVSLYVPRWFNKPFAHFKQIAPTREILETYHEIHDIEKYKKQYYADVLSKLNVDIVAETLDERVLLCYEKPTDFCHRHLIAEWLNSAGYEAKEI